MFLARVVYQKMMFRMMTAIMTMVPNTAGRSSQLIYPNGISTSLPTDVQLAMVRSMKGLERVEMVIPGYAVEYDYIDPRALDRSLKIQAFEGLYCAGQINGTTGYDAGR